jgi:hypothetical protein
MRKPILITAIVLVFVGVAIGSYLLSPSSVGSGTVLNKDCQELTESKPAESAFEVYKGCEMGEQENIQNISDLLIALPDDINNNNTKNLTTGAAEFLKSHKATDILPAGVKLEIIQSSWRRTALVGSIDIKVSGPYLWSPQSMFRAVFENGNDGWKLSNTLKS